MLKIWWKRETTQLCLCHEDIRLKGGNTPQCPSSNAAAEIWPHAKWDAKLLLLQRNRKIPTRLNFLVILEIGLLCLPHPFEALWLASTCIVIGLSELANFCFGGFGFLFFFTFYFILECGWLTMLWQFQVDSKGIQPYIYMYPFSPKLPSQPGCHKHWADFPMLYSRTLLVIRFKYSSVYMSIPNSLTNPSPTSPPDNHKFMNKQTLNPGARDWIFVSPRFLCWILMPDVMVLGGRALGTCSVCEGRALMNRISALWNRLQDSTVLAQRQKYRSMEQNRKPRDKSMHLWTPYLWQRRQKYTIEKRQSL